MAELTRGDDLNFPVQLKKDNATFIIDSTATVKANFVDPVTDLKMLSTSVVLSNITSGADWDTGLIVIVVSSTLSADLIPGPAEIEIQIDDDINTDGKQSWHVPVTILADVIP